MTVIKTEAVPFFKGKMFYVGITAIKMQLMPFLVFNSHVPILLKNNESLLFLYQSDIKLMNYSLNNLSN